MTINSTIRSAGPYAGTGSVKDYAFAFKVFSDDDLLVVRATSAGVQTTLTLGTDYAVDLNPDQDDAPGGWVRLAANLTAGHTLTITSDVRALQPLSLVQAGGYYPQSLENALDRLTMLVQQVGATGVGQLLRVPDVAGVPALPAAPGRALQLLGFDASGAPVAVAPATGTATDLASNLLSTTDAGKGAGQVGFDAARSYGAATVGGALKSLQGATSALVVADVAALRLVDKNSARVVRTRFYTLAHAQPRSGGTYVLDPADTSSSDTGGTVIVAADGGRWRLQIEGEALPAAQCGVRSGAMVSGSYPTGQTALLLNAMDNARSVNRALLIDGWVLLDAQLVIGGPIKIIFAGRDGLGATYTALDLPQSAFVLPPTGHATGQSGVVVEHPGVWFVGGGIVCDLASGHATTRFPYDGLTVLGHGFRWDSGLVFGCGRTGIRIGEGSTGPGRNSSRTMLLHCRSMWNGDKGFHISDDTDPIDANTFVLEGCIAQRNVNQGLYISKALFGGVVIGFLAEHNGVGGYVEDACRDIVFLGGDFEINDGPSGGGTLTNLTLAGRAAWRNRFIGVKVQDTSNTSLSVTLNAPQGLRGTYNPELLGFSTAGTLTYQSRKASWSYDGEILTVTGEFNATAGATNRPAGHMTITLPVLPGFSGLRYNQIDPTAMQFPIGQVAWVQVGSNALPVLPAGALYGVVWMDQTTPRMALYVQGTTGAAAVAPTWANNDWVGVTFSVRIPLNLTTVLA